MTDKAKGNETQLTVSQVNQTNQSHQKIFGIEEALNIFDFSQIIL